MSRPCATEYARCPRTDFLAGRLAVLIELAEEALFRTGKGQRLLAAARARIWRTRSVRSPIVSESLWKDRQL